MSELFRKSKSDNPSGWSKNNRLGSSKTTLSMGPVAARSVCELAALLFVLSSPITVLTVSNRLKEARYREV
jgi:hypothetical protein